MGVQIPLPPLLGIASIIVSPRNQAIFCTGGAWHGAVQGPQNLAVRRVETLLATVPLLDPHDYIPTGERRLTLSSDTQPRR